MRECNKATFLKQSKCSSGYCLDTYHLGTPYVYTTSSSRMEEKQDITCKKSNIYIYTHTQYIHTLYITKGLVKRCCVNRTIKLTGYNLISYERRLEYYLLFVISPSDPVLQQSCLHSYHTPFPAAYQELPNYH